MDVKGKIQCFTGDGKGKTSIAIGTVIRAQQNGLKCCFIFLFKSIYSSEMLFFKKIKDVDVFNFYSKCQNDSIHEKDFKIGKIPFCKKCFEICGDEEKIANTAILKFEELLNSNIYDLIVLDELGFLFSKKLISDKKFLSILKNRTSNVDIIITGRDIPESVLKICDLVTECKNIKHYNLCRKGFEY